MKVRAKELGIYDLKRMREGVVFHIKDKSELKRWMEPLEDVAAPKSKKSEDIVLDEKPKARRAADKGVI